MTIEPISPSPFSIEFHLDYLPPRCKLEMEINADPWAGVIFRVRPVRLRWFRGSLALAPWSKWYAAGTTFHFRWDELLELVEHD